MVVGLEGHQSHGVVLFGLESNLPPALAVHGLKPIAPTLTILAQPLVTQQLTCAWCLQKVHFYYRESMI